MQSDLQNPQLYNRDAQTLTIVSYFRKIFMLYVQWEVIIIHPKYASIPRHLQRLQEKLRNGQCHQVQQINVRIRHIYWFR